MQREGLAPEVRINEALLHRLAEAVAGMASPTLRPASLDGLLAVRGVVEIRDAEDDKELLRVQQDALTGLDQGYAAGRVLRQARRDYGTRGPATDDHEIECLRHLFPPALLLVILAPPLVLSINSQSSRRLVVGRHVHPF